ncbi:hypothetical protein [Anaerosinus massiliensis]|uniref:hypothetical protein n=1 Tax=Massilibacillus massiliensis TaxID=1806837 RepID=UPI000DA5FC77|nr:hypothetical protein [Massilibacillus massiliensis]
MYLFTEVKEKRKELEKLRIVAQATEITYRQKGELHTAERFKKLEIKLAQAFELLNLDDL